MFADKTSARIVGVLFIVATVTAIVGGALVEEPLKRSNALVDAAGSEGRIVTGVLFELVLVASVVGVGALLFPVLRRRKRDSPWDASARGSSRACSCSPRRSAAWCS